MKTMKKSYRHVAWKTWWHNYIVASKKCHTRSIDIIYRRTFNNPFAVIEALGEKHDDITDNNDSVYFDSPKFIAREK